MTGTQLDERKHAGNKDEYVILNLSMKVSPAEGEAMQVQENIVIVYVGVKYNDGTIWAVKQAVKVVTEEDGMIKERVPTHEEKGIMPTWVRVNTCKLCYEGEAAKWLHIDSYSLDFNSTADTSFLPDDNEEVPDNIVKKLGNLLMAYNLSMHMKDLKQNVPMILHVLYYADQQQKHMRREERFFFVKSVYGTYGKSLMVAGGDSRFVRFAGCQDCDNPQEYSKTVPGWFHKEAKIVDGDKRTICTVTSEDVPADILAALNYMEKLYCEL